MGHKLIKFSSDLGGKQNGIKRILGKPDVFPQGGSSANAWMPKNALDGKEVVEVGFEKPQTVKQVAVFENLNSGCVVKISVDNGSGKYETVWSENQIGKHRFTKPHLLQIEVIILAENEEKFRKYRKFSIPELNMLF